MQIIECRLSLLCNQHVISLDNIISRMPFCFVIFCLHCETGAVAIMHRDKGRIVLRKFIDLHRTNT